MALQQIQNDCSSPCLNELDLIFPHRITPIPLLLLAGKSDSSKVLLKGTPWALFTLLPHFNNHEGLNASSLFIEVI